LICLTDHFKVIGAIFLGVENYWGERKLNSECMEKVGSLMLDNFRKVGIFAISIYYEVTLPSKKMLAVKCEGFMLAEK